MATEDELILVTGSSGFIATHIVRAFLDSGYRVRGTARSEETARKVRGEFPEASETNLSFSIVPDIAAEGALDEAVKGVSGVIHTAAPVFFGATEYDEKLLEPAIAGTRNMLKSVQQHGAAVKAVVITSSFAAIQDFSKGTRPGYTYTEADWMPLTEEHVKKMPNLMYPLSKTLAEREAWRWYGSNKPTWKLAAICPPMVYGPVSKSISTSQLNSSSSAIYRILSGEAKEIPSTVMPAFADVRDVAQMHLKAYQLRADGRFIPTGGKYLFGWICEILKKSFPDRVDTIPTPTAEELALETFMVNNKRAVNVLGMTFRGLEECITDGARSYLALENSEGESSTHT